MKILKNSQSWQDFRKTYMLRVRVQASNISVPPVDRSQEMNKVSHFH